MPKELQNKDLLEKLKKESSYIVKWVMIGLKRLRKNNYLFTTSNEIEDLVNEYSQKTNSFDGFINSCCIIDPHSRIFTSVLYEAYENYCIEIDVILVSYQTFNKSLKSQTKLRKARIRNKNNDENRNGYIGIKLKEEFELEM